MRSGKTQRMPRRHQACGIAFETDRNFIRLICLAMRTGAGEEIGARSPVRLIFKHARIRREADR